MSRASEKKIIQETAAFPISTETLCEAVDHLFDEQVAFLADLVAMPSVRGNEKPAQKKMADAMSSVAMKVEQFTIDLERIRHLRGFSPAHIAYDEAINIVGHFGNPKGEGHSLILNGHIDVVPEGPLAGWKSPPYRPEIRDGWMYGRGVADMKAGLVASLYALKALEACGFEPDASVFLQSVVEEECTGNGTLACLERGYKADAVLIGEPFNEQLVRAQVGVIWFQLVVYGTPVHALNAAAAGVNAIEATSSLFSAMHALEEEWNRQKNRYAPYADHHHPINLNIGKIEGGNWASSVPSRCVVEMRIAIYPGQTIDDAKRDIEACIRDHVARSPKQYPQAPEITYHGFLAEGYVLPASEAEKHLRAAHQSIYGVPLKEQVITATTDARFYGLYADTPSLVYGPNCKDIHGFNECVELESVRKLTQTYALFIANWCGLSALQEPIPVIFL